MHMHPLECEAVVVVSVLLIAMQANIRVRMSVAFYSTFNHSTNIKRVHSVCVCADMCNIFNITRCCANGSHALLVKRVHALCVCIM